MIGLPNEALTRTRLRELLNRFCEHRLSFSILIISLADNKLFTATHGHPAAERMLQSAAQTLSNVLRPSDFLGRWKGDRLLPILIGNRGTAGSSSHLGNSLDGHKFTGGEIQCRFRLSWQAPNRRLEARSRVCWIVQSRN